MTTILLLVIMLNNGDIIRSPGFEFETREDCEKRANKVEQDWFDKKGITSIQWQCVPVQTPEKWLTKENV